MKNYTTKAEYKKTITRQLKNYYTKEESAEDPKEGFSGHNVKESKKQSKKTDAPDFDNLY